MTQPLVSVLIPCRNSETTIRAAIDSALMQDYGRLEVVVSDSGSTDGSVAIIKSYDDERLRTYFHKDRSRLDNYRGLYYEYAKGDLCLNVDSDDYLTDPSYISKAVSAFQANPGTVLIFAKAQVLIDATGEIIEEPVNDKLPAVMDGKWLFEIFPKGHNLPSTTCLVDARLAREVEIFRTDINSADWEAFLKLMLHGKVCFLRENVSVYRRHANNSTKTLNVDWLIEGASYVDHVYEYALRKELLPPETLRRWRLQLLKRYFIKTVVRTRLLGESRTEAELTERLRDQHPGVMKAIVRDPRYQLFNLVHRWRPVMRLIFRHYVKQEGFHTDLVTTVVLPEHHGTYHGLKKPPKES
jgi:glycosyltransferase involved in cell wall biosynthesis